MSKLMRNVYPFNRRGMAVVNIIVKMAPSPAILLVKKRASPDDPWSLDIAFPGGMVRRGESLVGALLRETYEETGIPGSALEVVALVALDTPRIMPNINVYAFLSLLSDSFESVRLDLSEVSEAVWAEISKIKGPARMYHSLKKASIEAYVYSHYIIWGVSKRILESSLFLLRAMMKRSEGLSA